MLPVFIKLHKVAGTTVANVLRCITEAPPPPPPRRAAAAAAADPLAAAAAAYERAPHHAAIAGAAAAAEAAAAARPLAVAPDRAALATWGPACSRVTRLFGHGTVAAYRRQGVGVFATCMNVWPKAPAPPPPRGMFRLLLLARDPVERFFSIWGFFADGTARASLQRLRDARAREDLRARARARARGGGDEVRAAVARMLETRGGGGAGGAAAAALAPRRKPGDADDDAAHVALFGELTRGVFSQNKTAARDPRHGAARADFQSPWGVHQLIDVLASPAGATRNARAGEVGRAHVDARARRSRATLSSARPRRSSASSCSSRSSSASRSAPCACPARSAARARAASSGSATRRAAAAGSARTSRRRGRCRARVTATRGHRAHYPMSVIAAAEALLAPDLELHAEVLALAAAQERRHGAAFDRALARFASDQFRAKSCAARTRELVAAGAAHFDPAHPGRVDNTRASCTSSRRAVAPR